MILIGSFNGFNLYFLSDSDVLAFADANSLYAVKTTGFILFYITIALTVVLLLAYVFLRKFKQKANFTFNIRRKMVEKVRSEAQKTV